ncbi:MAG: nicotinamidase [Betaproteobacteria bacterium RIFCSPLOWO2_12_FULL_65_110]|nr:MAG: nicotinamidase [Betaproteobacteria bacterium RIFCSPLOWO2_12_FULL_65_110]
MRQVDKKFRLMAIVGVLAVGAGLSTPALSQTLVDEWAGVKAPPPPELKPVTIDPKVTALLMLDLVKPFCGPRPRCGASLPAVQRLLTQARAKGVQVVYTLGTKVADIYPELAPVAGEHVVTSGPDKFLNTDLEKVLKEKGIKVVIAVGTAAEGAVLHTAAGAALRGLKVIVPLDGMSSLTTYAEQYTAWHLTNAPRLGAQTTLTRIDLIGY